MLEAQVALTPEVVRGLRIADDDDVLDTYPEAAVGVIPGFCHALRQRVVC